MNANVDVEHMKAWRAGLRAEIEEDKADLARLQAKIRDSEQRLDLVDRLLALEGDRAEDRQAAPGARSNDFLEACEKVLKERGEPMHIRDIHETLLSNGVAIPGKGNQANVISRLQRSDGRIIRTGRGMYGIPEFGYPEVKPTRKKKRAKRKQQTG